MRAASLALALQLFISKPCNAVEQDCWNTLGGNGLDQGLMEAVLALVDAGQDTWSKNTINSCALEFFNTPPEWREQDWFTWRSFPGVTAAELLDRLAASSTRVDGLELCHGLAVLGDQAVPALITALHSGQPRQRSLAAALLAQNGGNEAIRALSDLMRGDSRREDVAISYFALFAVGKAAAGAVEQIARSATGRPRAFALVLLGFVGDHHAAPTLRAAAAEGSREIRLAGIQGLIRVLGSGASTDIAWVLKNSDLKAKRSIISALSRRKPDPEIARLLLEPLRDEYQIVREDAAGALGRIGDARLIPALREMILSGDRFARSGAVFALEKIGDASATPELLDTLGDPLVCTRRTAAAVLGRLGDASQVPRLVDLLEHGSRYAREGALRALPYLHDPAATPAVLAALRENDDTIRRLALGFLAATKDERSIPALIAFLAAGAMGDRAREADGILRRLTGQSFGYSPWEPDAARRMSAVRGWERWWEEHRETFRTPVPELTLDEDVIVSVDHPVVESTQAPVKIITSPTELSRRGPVGGAARGFFSIGVYVRGPNSLQGIDLSPSDGGFYRNDRDKFWAIRRERSFDFDDPPWNVKVKVLDYAEAETVLTMPLRENGVTRGLVFTWVKFHMHATKKSNP